MAAAIRNGNVGETIGRKRKARGGANNSTYRPQQMEMYSNKWMMKVFEEKPAFPDDLFETTFAKAKLQTIVAALKMATEKEVEESCRLLPEDYFYSLQVTCHKVPHVNVHLRRITLLNSLLGADSEIALFVKDIHRFEYEPTIQHYENLFKAKNINHNITIIPINQLYTEYSTFEDRRKLSFLYEKLLVDRQVAAHVNGFLGSKMLKKGCLAIPVDMAAENLNESIDKSLRQVIYKHCNRGNILSIKVGKHSLSDECIAENIIGLLRQFGDIHPGGYKNVHKLHLRPHANLAISIPIYVSMAKPIATVPASETPADGTVTDETKKATETLENFDITEAAKLVKKRFKSASIVSDDILLSEEETDAPEMKKPRLFLRDQKPPEKIAAEKVQPNNPLPEKIIKKRNDSFPKPVNNPPPVDTAPRNKPKNRPRGGLNLGAGQAMSADNLNRSNDFDGNFGNNDFTRRSNRGGNIDFDMNLGNNDFTRRLNRNSNNNDFVGDDTLNIGNNLNRILESFKRGDNRNDFFNRPGDNFGRNEPFNRSFGNNSFGGNSSSNGGGRFNNRY